MIEPLEYDDNKTKYSICLSGFVFTKRNVSQQPDTSAENVVSGNSYCVLYIYIYILYCNVMRSTLAVSECWQKDKKTTKKTKKNKSKKHFKKPKTRKKQKKQLRRRKVFFSFFFVFFRNVPWTQDLTTVSQKKTKKNKKNLPPSELFFFVFFSGFCFFEVFF